MASVCCSRLIVSNIRLMWRRTTYWPCRASFMPVQAPILWRSTSYCPLERSPLNWIKHGTCNRQVQVHGNKRHSFSVHSYWQPIVHAWFGTVESLAVDLLPGTSFLHLGIGLIFPTEQEMVLPISGQWRLLQWRRRVVWSTPLIEHSAWKQIRTMTFKAMNFFVHCVWCRKAIPAQAESPVFLICQFAAAMTIETPLHVFEADVRWLRKF